MRTINILLTGFFYLLLAACHKFEYSPYQAEPVADMPQNLNASNISKLLGQAALADDTVCLLYSGDAQRFYDELQALVDRANTLGHIDLFVLSGDLTDFGTLQEYQWVYRELNRLRVPYLCAIGNHDLTAEGERIFTRLFGQKNFSFTYKEYKFLFHDTNGREYGFQGKVPNLDWLSAELSDTLASWLVGISHVPPYHADFDKSLEMPYKNLLASRTNFLLSLHGHNHDHSDTYYYDDHVRYIISNSVVKREALLIKLIRGQVIKQFVSY